MWEGNIDPDPVKLHWLKDGKYQLVFKGEAISEGMIPPDIVQSFVFEMNAMYRAGVEDGIEKEKKSKNDK